MSPGEQMKWARGKARMLGHTMGKAVTSPPTTAIRRTRRIAVCQRCGAFLVVEGEMDAFSYGSALDHARPEDNPRTADRVRTACDVRYERGDRPASPDAEDRVQLTDAQMQILRMCAERPRITSKKTAEGLGWISGVAAKALEKYGLVELKAGPIAHITSEGRWALAVGSRKR